MTLTDARGCLTAEGLAEVARAAPGQAPPEAAAHLAACGRCQERLLGAERDRPRASGTARSPYRNVALVSGLLLLTLVLLGLTLAYLRG
jgi:hypothetical protein